MVFDIIKILGDAMRRHAHWLVPALETFTIVVFGSFYQSLGLNTRPMDATAYQGSYPLSEVRRA
jgi:hypothetical protein